jgi:hypothetical protein
MSAYVGQIAKKTAVNGIPTYRGYDLMQKPATTGLSLEDYELVFNNTTCQGLKELNAESVLKNIDKTFFRVLGQSVENSETIKETITQENEKKEKILCEFNGKVIKQFTIDTDDKIYIEVQAAHGHSPEEVNQITQQMFDLWNLTKQKATMKRIEVDQEFAKGKLDIAIQGDKEYLVTHKDNSTDGILNVVPTKLLKETLFYLINLHHASKEFRALINVEHTEGKYKLTVKKSQLYWDKTDGDWTELELDIIKDLKQLRF